MLDNNIQFHLGGDISPQKSEAYENLTFDTRVSDIRICLSDFLLRKKEN